MNEEKTKVVDMHPTENKPEPKEESKILKGEEALKGAEESEIKIGLQIPQILPTNGRIICQAISKKEYKTKSGLIIPRTTDPEMTDRERKEKGPGGIFIDHEYYVVSYAPEVKKDFKVPPIYNPQTNLWYNTRVEVLDQCVLSRNFYPVPYYENGILYAVVHMMDVLGIIKNPNNLKTLFSTTSGRKMDV